MKIIHSILAAIVASLLLTLMFVSPSAAAPQPATAADVASVELVPGPPEEPNSSQSRAVEANVNATAVCDDRTLSCSSSSGLILQYDKDGKQIGQYRVRVAFAIASDVRSLRSVAHLYVTIDKELASGVDGGNLKIKIQAQEYDTYTNPTERQVQEVNMSVAPGTHVDDLQFGYFTKTMRSANTFSVSDFEWDFAYAIYPPGMTPIVGAGTVGTDNTVRCDNWTKLQGGTPGCVNPDYEPTHAMDGRTPYINENILEAQQEWGDLGAPYSEQPLHRVTDEERDANRNAACSTARMNALPDPDPAMPLPKSCDEYPLASSQEGGGGSRITWVPLAENDSQGGQMSQFYNRNRVLAYTFARDGYYVDATGTGIGD